MPNDMTFARGMLSRIVAAGRLPTVTRRIGITWKTLGAAPKVQRSVAPLMVCIAMAAPPKAHFYQNIKYLFG
jgi:hypothetical protein